LSCLCCYKIQHNKCGHLFAITKINAKLFQTVGTEEMLFRLENVLFVKFLESIQLRVKNTELIDELISICLLISPNLRAEVEEFIDLYSFYCST